MTVVQVTSKIVIKQIQSSELHVMYILMKYISTCFINVKTKVCNIFFHAGRI